MPLELMVPDISTKPAFPGNKGYLILAKLRGMRNVKRESLRLLRSLTIEYCKERYPEELETAEAAAAANADANEEKKPVVEEVKTEETDKDKEEKAENADAAAFPDSVIKFGPHELMYDNCSFILTNLVDPSDYSQFVFSKLADDPSWPQPRFPLRIMPVQEICSLTRKSVEETATTLLEKIFGGEEPLRFSIIFHGKLHQDSKDMPRQEIEAIIRNIIWSVNPNCVQCIKYQDYAILLEVVDPMLFMGVAKDFNQLGRYNTATITNGRDMKEAMDDSEDDISDDPELSEADNIKRKLRIKKKRRAEKEEDEMAKQAKLDGGDGNKDDEVLAADDNEINGN